MRKISILLILSLAVVLFPAITASHRKASNTSKNYWRARVSQFRKVACTCLIRPTCSGTIYCPAVFATMPILRTPSTLFPKGRVR